MAYRVIRHFYDLNDSGCEYNVGDSFPRKGLTVSGARLKELSTDKNRLKAPVIQEVKPEPKPETKQPAKSRKKGA